MVWQKYFKGGENERLGGQIYTKYNKINNNSENFRWCKIAARRAFSPLASLSCGPE